MNRCGATNSKSNTIFLSDYGEFDPGSGRTLAEWIRHASRTRFIPSGILRVANG